MAEQHGFAEVNGTRLYYEVAGEGDPLVLLHGLTLDTRMWDPQFETLAGRFQLLRYDLRGFGRSDLPSQEAYAHEDDLKSLLDHLGFSRPTLLGLSLGGGVVLDFALTYPEVARALILVDTVLGGFEWSPEQKAADRAVWSKGRESGAPAAKEAWLRHPLFEPALENPRAGALLRDMVSGYSGWHFVTRDPRGSIEPPTIQRLGQIAAPTLTVVGERDLPDFHRIAGLLEQGVPGARRAVLPGAGHLSSMESPDRFNEVVLDFLSDVAG
jgi:3-oxoadipate enol-lactonase